MIVYSMSGCKGITYNVELVLGMDLEELAMLRQEIDELRDSKKDE